MKYNINDIVYSIDVFNSGKQFIIRKLKVAEYNSKYDDSIRCVTKDFIECGVFPRWIPPTKIDSESDYGEREIWPTVEEAIRYAVGTNGNPRMYIRGCFGEA
jgi:hypothetical protein